MALAASQPSASAPPPELHSGQDVVAWKREYNIRQREADWKRRQDELLTKKQVEWQIECCERENRIASARECRRREELEGRVEQRHHEIDSRYKERCRNSEIEKREKAWEDRENTRLMARNRETKRLAAEASERRANLKVQLCDQLRQDAADRSDKQKKDNELNQKRQENIRRREEERKRKAADRAQELKQDATAKSHMTVSGFIERTVPVDSTLVSILTQRAVDPQYSHFGASPTGIL